MIKRLLSLILSLLIITTSMPLLTFADEEPQFAKLLVRQNEYRVIDVIKDGDEIFMKADDLSFLSTFSYSNEGHNTYFTRGAKTVFVDMKSNTVSIKGRNYGLSLNPGCKNIDGVWYLQLLIFSLGLTCR